jgi:hypothetical protein
VFCVCMCVGARALARELYQPVPRCQKQPNPQGRRTQHQLEPLGHIRCLSVRMYEDHVADLQLRTVIRAQKQHPKGKGKPQGCRELLLMRICCVGRRAWCVRTHARAACLCLCLCVFRFLASNATIAVPSLSIDSASMITLKSAHTLSTVSAPAHSTCYAVAAAQPPAPQ